MDEEPDSHDFQAIKVGRLVDYLTKREKSGPSYASTRTPAAYAGYKGTDIRPSTSGSQPEPFVALSQQNIYAATINKTCYVNKNSYNHQDMWLSCSCFKAASSWAAR